MARKAQFTQVGKRKLEISNLDKPFCAESGVIKAEIIAYYLNIAPALLRHIKGSPLTLVRYPDGVNGQSFFQKNKPEKTPPWIDDVKLGDGDKKINYIMAMEDATLVWTANLAAIELHQMHSRSPHFEGEDFDKIKLKSTKVIEMEGFVDASEVDITLYDSPYFIGPDGPVAAKIYSLLSDALKETGKLCIGKVVLRDREDAVLVGAHPEGIMLCKIRYPETLRKMSGVPMLEQHETDPEQLKLAVSLIESMETSLDQIELTDQYQDALREMIQAKIDGKEIVSATEEEPQVIDIMSALKQSIENAQSERKPMAKADTATKTAKKAKKTKKAAAKKAKVA